MCTAPLVGSPSGSNSYEESTINFADEVVNSFTSQHSFEPSVDFNTVLTHENVGSTSSGGRGRSGSISGHSAMNVQGVIGAEVLASDELVQLLRGNPSIEPTPVSASGKKLGGVLGVIARASCNWKTGKSRIVEEGKTRRTGRLSMVSWSRSGIAAKDCSASTSLRLAFLVDQETTASRRLSLSTTSPHPIRPHIPSRTSWKRTPICWMSAPSLC
jgi:hypothetical protein